MRILRDTIGCILICLLICAVFAPPCEADDDEVSPYAYYSDSDSITIEFFKMIERYEQRSDFRSEDVLSYSGSAMWIYTADVEVVGDYLYAIGPNGLQVFDISNLLTPVLVAEHRLKMASMYCHLAHADDFLFVPAYDELIIKDLTDPVNPTEVGSVKLSGNIDAIEVVGDRAFVGIGRYAGDFSEEPSFYIIDISEPSTPTVMGKYTSPNSYRDARRLIILDDYVYVSNYWEKAIEVVSIADETQPVHVRTYYQLASNDIAHNNGYIYLAGSNLRVYEITEPGKLSMVHEFETPSLGELATTDSLLLAMEFYDPKTHVYNIFDDWNLDSIGTHISRGSFYSLKLDEERMFIGEANWGWSAADFSDPADMPRIGEYSTPASDLMGIDVKDDLVYISNYMSYGSGDSSMRRNGIHVVDASDKQNPQFVRHVYCSGNTSHIFVQDDLLFLSQAPWTEIYSLGTPDFPSYLGKFLPEEYRYTYSCLARGDYMYVCSSGGFEVGDISDPSWPVLLGGVEIGTYPYSAELRDNIAYVLNIVDRQDSDEAQLITVDITDPTDLQILDVYVIRRFPSKSGHYNQINMRGDYLVVSLGIHGIFILDASNPVKPDLIATYSIPGSSYYDAAFARNYMFAIGFTGIEVVDISSPQSPAIVQYIPLASMAQRAEVSGNYLHVASRLGYYLFELTLPPTACGDIDWSGGVDIDDVVALIEYVFQGGLPPDPIESGDVDCSGGVDIDDIVYLIAYVFQGGEEPCAGC